ncbi:hypothetical protein E0H77_09610 [Acinetobacter sp. ANC 4633]|nr:hypothetical protein E0H77_09610 [Acinetobacter sp. ANC 4633]
MDHMPELFCLFGDFCKKFNESFIAVLESFTEELKGILLGDKSDLSKVKAAALRNSFARSHSLF